MQIVRDLAGYSLGRADLVRRAMGKKKATSGSAVSTEDSDEESDDTTEATE